MGQATAVCVGRISGVFGVKGWVRIYSYTEPRENILDYQPWFREPALSEALVLESGQTHGKGILAKLRGVDDRDAAAGLIDQSLWIARTQLPELEPGAYYWSDLVGLQVETSDGLPLGQVDHLFATGANDVLVVRGDRERLIPFVLDHTVLEVNFQQGRLVVDWDPTF